MSWQPKAPRTNRGWLLLLGSFVALNPIGLEMYILALPAIATGLDTDIVTTQLTMTALLFGAAAGQFVGGPISDLVGRRMPVLVGLAMVAASMGLGAAAPSIGVLIACRAIAGIGAGVVVVCANATVRDRYSGMNLAKTFSQVMVINALVPVVGPTIGSGVMRVAGWRGLVAFLGVIAFGIFVAAFRKLPDTNVTKVHETRWLSRMRSDGIALARDRDFVGYTVVVLLGSAAFFAAMSASAFVLQGGFGLSAFQFSIVLGVNSLGIVLVNLFAWKRVHVYGPRRLLMLGLALLLVTAVLLLAATSGSLPFLLVGLFTLNIGVGLIFPAARALAPHKHAERAGSAYAILGVTQFVVAGLAAPLTGLLPWALLTSLGVVVAVLSVAAVGALFITERTTAERPTASA